jgi:hypothetical protein
MSARVDEESNFLAKLAAIAPEGWWKLGPGQPRNFAAYLVLYDAAAIFRWYSGKKAARGVHRVSGNETGPFFRFVSVVWPAVFGRGIQGLPAAMNNWADAGSKHSAVVANIDLRHRAWGVYDC